jgi:hypothetical protein
MGCVAALDRRPPWIATLTPELPSYGPELVPVGRHFAKPSDAPLQ